jgi:hypothetical protein
VGDQSDRAKSTFPAAIDGDAAEQWPTFLGQARARDLLNGAEADRADTDKKASEIECATEKEECG